MFSLQKSHCYVFLELYMYTRICLDHRQTFDFVLGVVYDSI